MHGDDDQIVPIEAQAAASVKSVSEKALIAAGRMSAKIVKGATLKVYPGFPHGMLATNADPINSDLFEFFQQSKPAAAEPYPAFTLGTPLLAGVPVSFIELFTNVCLRCVLAKEMNYESSEAKGERMAMLPFAPQKREEGQAPDNLSGNGADPTGRSRIPFARYKGEAENALLAAGFPQVYIFRPAYIYPVEPRKEPNLTYRLLRRMYPLFRVLFPNQVIRADDLARAMVDVAVRKTGQRRTLVLENRDIRAIIKSHNVPMGYPHASV